MKKQRQPDADLHGIVVVDKPAGFTSFDVIAKLRGVLKTRRIGHSGTLDPMATGVLPLFIGSATKAVDMQLREDKVYCAQMQLGIRTDTGDITGEVLSRAPIHVGEQELREVLPRFLGEQSQIPPMYSAVKVDGQPLYKLARAGKTVERRPRAVTVHEIRLMGACGADCYQLEVRCSKGTYIRTLLEDIGEALGLPATMAALRRTASGPYTEAQAHSLEELIKAAQAGEVQSLLAPVETVFEGYPRLDADLATVGRLYHGAKTKCRLPDNKYAVYYKERFLGVAAAQDGELKVLRMFAPLPETQE